MVQQRNLTGEFAWAGSRLGPVAVPWVHAYDVVRADRDGDGHIEHKELAVVMRIMGMQPSKQQLDDLIKSVDRDGNGKVGPTSRTPPPARLSPHRAASLRRSCARSGGVRRLEAPGPQPPAPGPWPLAPPCVTCARQIELEEFANLMARQMLLRDGKVGCASLEPHCDFCSPLLLGCRGAGLHGASQRSAALCCQGAGIAARPGRRSVRPPGRIGLQPGCSERSVLATS